jgi:hypothetical protein
MQNVLKLAALVILLSSCNTYKTKYPYSLDDFRPEYRKHLENTIELGIAGASYSGEEAIKLAEEFYKNCSITDLKKILQCEHPLLRAHAFRILAEKDSTNIEAILLSSLDDTAIISVDHGEWGIPTMYCADFYLDIVRNERIKLEHNLLDILIEKYPHLETTFIRLRTTPTLPEKYYSSVKKIAESTVKNYSGFGNSTPYITHDDEKVNDILFALSEYKKEEDIDFIKTHSRLNDRFIWEIIRNNPDIRYFSFIKEYFERLENGKKNGSEYLQSIIYGKEKMQMNFDEFLLTLSKFKTRESVEMVSKILNDKLYPYRGNVRPNQFECTLFDILSIEKYSEYKNLIISLKPLAEKFKKQYNIPLNESTLERR